MPNRASAQRAERIAPEWVCCIAALAAAWVGCAELAATAPAHNIDRVSRSSKAFGAFLQSPGKTIDQIRALMPDAGVDSVYLIDENVTNEELGEYIESEASNYPFEIFLRVTVSAANQHVYRYIVKGDWRSVKMGYGSLNHPELYDAIYLHTHPRGKRIIPNSIPDFVHAETFKNVSTLLVGNGISIEFESVEKSGSGVDQFEVDGREFSLKRPERQRLRSKEQRRRSRRSAGDVVRELDHIFRENVENGHERVALQNSEGILVTYERSRVLDRRLDEVYRNAGVHLPMGGDRLASPRDITPAIQPESTHPLGF